VSRDRDTAAVCACRVPLGEIAQQVGATVEHVTDRATHAGYVIRDDWAGRPAPAVVDATALVLWMKARPQ
jgi:hypothetical protein